MDICVSSNFERYLYHLLDDDASSLKNLMTAFESTGKLTLSGQTLAKAKSDFKSARCDTAETLNVIRSYHAEHGYMLCPHSAVGVSALHQVGLADDRSVALATAHEGKFPAACEQVRGGLEQSEPGRRKRNETRNDC